MKLLVRQDRVCLAARLRSQMLIQIKFDGFDHKMNRTVGKGVHATSGVFTSGWIDAITVRRKPGRVRRDTRSVLPVRRRDRVHDGLRVVGREIMPAIATEMRVAGVTFLAPLFDPILRQIRIIPRRRTGIGPRILSVRREGKSCHRHRRFLFRQRESCWPVRP